MLFDEALNKELLKIVVDKLAIGLLIVLAGYILNRAIERFKAAEALRNELSKQRFAAKLARVERQLSEFYWPVYLRLQMDNTVWERLLDKNRDEGDPLKILGNQIEVDFLLPNHREIVKIIESKIQLAEPDGALQSLLLEYINHVAVYNAAIAAGFKDLHNTQRALLTPWPKNLFGAIEARTLSLQKYYEESLREIQQA
jgi:hypothetical protein